MCFEHSLCILGSQISRYWTSNFRQIGENWEAMATQEEVIEDIRELKGEIGQLKKEIGLLVDQRSTANKMLKVSLGAEISEKTALMTAKQNSLTASKETLNLYLKSQQGNFSSRSSVVPS